MYSELTPPVLAQVHSTARTFFFPPFVRQPLLHCIEHLQRRIGAIAVVQALAAAHLRHDVLDVAHSPRPCPSPLHGTDVLLPPFVRQPLLHCIEHLQRRIGAIAVVQALAAAHLRHLPLNVHLTAPEPFLLQGTNLTLPSVVGYERRQLIYFDQLWNAFAAARMHHSCLWLLCRTLDVLVVRHEDRTDGG